MLEHDERHAGVGRELREESLERFESARRGADGDNLEIGRVLLLLILRLVLRHDGTLALVFHATTRETFRATHPARPEHKPRQPSLAAGGIARSAAKSETYGYNQFIRTDGLRGVPTVRSQYKGRLARSQRFPVAGGRAHP